MDKAFCVATAPRYRACTTESCATRRCGEESPEEFWTGLVQGRSGIAPITKFDAATKDASGQYQYATRIAGEIRNFDPLKFVDKKEARRLDLFLQYAMACAVMAVEDAGLDMVLVSGDPGLPAAGLNPPAPFPSSTATLLVVELAVTTSRMPSPFMSATAIDVGGLAATGKLTGGAKHGAGQGMIVRPESGRATDTEAAPRPVSGSMTSN